LYFFFAWVHDHSRSIQRNTRYGLAGNVKKFILTRFGCCIFAGPLIASISRSLLTRLQTEER